MDQLEKSIAESEKDFPTEQIIGEIKEDVECIIEGEALPDMTTENIEIISEQNEGLQEEFMIESELEEITPIKTDIKEDDETWLIKFEHLLDSEHCPNFVKAEVERARGGARYIQAGHD